MAASFPWRVHCAPDGTAVALGHAVAKFRNPKRIPCRTKAPQHIAMLVTCLDGGKRRQGKGGHARIDDGRHG